MQLVGDGGVLLLGGQQSAVVDARSGARRWSLAGTGVAQQLVADRDGRRLARLPGMKHERVPPAAESFRVGEDGSRAVLPPSGTDWRGAVWLDGDQLLLHVARAIYRWEIGSGALTLVAESDVDITAIAAAGERILAGHADGAVVLVS
jgi:hypothetical protein